MIGVRTLFLLLILFSAQVFAASAPVLSCTDSLTTAGSTDRQRTAPVVVHTDCKATTDADLSGTEAFRKLLYTHSWNDTQGNWNTGAIAGSAVTAGLGDSLNLAHGPITAHLYETAGTISRTTCVSDGTTQDCETVSIVIVDPDVTYSGSNTTCVSADSTPTAGAGGCPTGSDVAQQSSWDTIINTYKGTGGVGKRILLKGGDSFTKVGGPSNVSVEGLFISSYGTGRAIVEMDAAQTSFALTLQDSAGSYLKIYNVEFDGNSGVGSFVGDINGRSDYISLINNYVHDLAQGINLANDGYVGNAVVGNIVENVIGGAGGVGIFMMGSGHAVMGNHVSGLDLSEHAMRTMGLRTSVISNNTLYGAGTIYGGKHALTIRAWGDTTPATTPSQYLVIDRNYIYAASSFTTNLTFEVSDIVMTRNYIGSDTQQIVSIDGATEVFFGNNILSANAPAIGLAISESDQLIESSNVDVINNTIYISGAPATFQAVRQDADVTNGTNVIRNNLSFSPKVVGTNVFLNDAATPPATASNNTGDVGSVTTDPFTTTPSSSNLVTFAPSTAAYAYNAGTSAFPATGLFGDFFRCHHKTASTYQIGAIVDRANAICTGRPEVQ